jgi:hypothetical protein
MATKQKVVEHCETVRIEISENEIADILLRHFEVQTGGVDFDVSGGGYLRSATITIKTASTENYDLGEVNVSRY